MITYSTNRAFKSEMRIPVAIALRYAEEVAEEELEDALAGKASPGDPILTTLHKRLTDLLNDTATNEQVIQFVHLAECVSCTDFVQWLDKEGMSHWLQTMSKG